MSNIYFFSGPCGCGKSTLSEEAIEERIQERGDVEMIERALFLKNKLDNLPENQGHLFDNTGKTVQ